MKKIRVWWVLLSLSAVLILTAGALWAMDTNQGSGPQEAAQVSAVPNQISYQGVYSENGIRVSGSRNMVFQLFNNSSCGGSPLQSITKNSVPLQDGLFHVVLDVNAAHFNGQALWLRVQIAGSNYGCEQILPAPYALYSASTDFHKLLGQTLTGLNNPLVISGTYSALPLTDGAPAGAPLVVSNILTTGMGVRVLNATYGLYVDQAQWYGLWISQAGLYGIVSNGNDIGVLGRAQSTGANYGVYGDTASSSGTGVYGIATANSGTTYGVQGAASSPAGRAVYGTHGNGNWGYLGGTFGAYGEHNSGNYGRIGTSFDGVVANSNVTNGYAVYGIQGPNAARAGHFLGHVHVTGNLSKGGGAFEIDHPLDPENRILRHSFVESPDMMNIYNGNVTLNDSGEAWVELPEWFETLNIEFRYQLTAIGQPAPNLYIAEEVQDNRFKIAGGEPGMTISWQVTGIRQDPWAVQNRIIVEEYKSTETRGFYLHPEVYGQPLSRSMEAALRPEMMQQMEETNDE